MRPSCLPALFLLLAASAARAQTVAQCGDDLQALVTAAPDGSVIEIQGSCLFAGTLSWSGKGLTLRAAPGYAPILQGSLAKPVIQLDAAVPTSAILEGLILVRGEMPALGFGPPSALGFGGNPATPITTKAVVRGCTLVGDVSLTGTGQFVMDLTVEDTSIAGRLTFGGTGSTQHLITVDASTIADDVVIGGTGDKSLHAQFHGCTLSGGLTLFSTGTAAAMTVAVVEDSQVHGGVTISTTGSRQHDLSFKRVRVEGGVKANAISSSTVSLSMESCLVIPGPSGFPAGIGTSGSVLGSFLNLTVAGFDVGLDPNATSVFENMLIFDNGQDLASGFPAGAISSSLIEEGTFAGLLGNLGGTPYVDQAYAPVPGSLGIDAGNSLALGLGALDLYGDPRIQDGDGDGIPEVNVGAVEGLGGTSASVAVFNGSGVNPLEFLAAGPPVVGSVFGVSIVLHPGTTATHVAIGWGPGTPYHDPGIAGEVLLQGPLLLVDHGVTPGVHLFPIPAHPALVGLELAMQGFRQEVGSFFALNGLSLVLGV